MVGYGTILHGSWKRRFQFDAAIGDRIPAHGLFTQRSQTLLESIRCHPPGPALPAAGPSEPASRCRGHSRGGDGFGCRSRAVWPGWPPLPRVLTGSLLTVVELAVGQHHLSCRPYNLQCPVDIRSSKRGVVRCPSCSSRRRARLARRAGGVGAPDGATKGVVFVLLVTVEDRRRTFTTASGRLGSVRGPDSPARSTSSTLSCSPTARGSTTMRPPRRFRP